MQAFIDELYQYKKLGLPPKVEAKITQSEDGSKHNVTWNIDFQKLAELAGSNLSFYISTPLAASVHSNRFLWSAANLGSDLYLPNPISTIVGDKLYESSQRITKVGKVITDLKVEVEFPDIRYLVNSGKLNFEEILTIRKKAAKFRNWLQLESERDRNAIIAYHYEVARESGMINCGRKLVNLFGVLGGGAAGTLVGNVIAGPAGGALGGVTGSAVGYLADVASKIGADWRPIVFGKWLRERIEEDN